MGTELFAVCTLVGPRGASFIVQNTHSENIRAQYKGVLPPLGP